MREVDWEEAIRYFFNSRGGFDQIPTQNWALFDRKEVLVGKRSSVYSFYFLRISSLEILGFLEELM